MGEDPVGDDGPPTRRQHRLRGLRPGLRLRGSKRWCGPFYMTMALLLTPTAAARRHTRPGAAPPFDGAWGCALGCVVHSSRPRGAPWRHAPTCDIRRSHVTPGACIPGFVITSSYQHSLARCVGRYVGLPISVAPLSEWVFLHAPPCTCTLAFNFSYAGLKWRRRQRGQWPQRRETPPAGRADGKDGGTIRTRS